MQSDWFKDIKGYKNAFYSFIFKFWVSLSWKIDRFLQVLTPTLYERILLNVDYSKEAIFEMAAKFTKR